MSTPVEYIQFVSNVCDQGFDKNLFLLTKSMDMLDS